MLDRSDVLMIHPLNRETASVLARTVEIPAGAKPTLRLLVSHPPSGDWDLILRGNGRQLLRQTVGRTTASNGWLEVRQDLSEFAGQTLALEVVNQPTGWSYEAAYFGVIVTFL